jgi:hypothetical protein
MSATRFELIRAGIEPDAESASVDLVLALRVTTAECCSAPRKQSSEVVLAALPQALAARPEQ